MRDSEYEALKRRLDELATLVNKFQSEAVQLRIVDLLFSDVRSGYSGLAEPERDDYVAGPERVLRDPSAVKGNRSSSRGGRQKPGVTLPSASGAVDALQRLINDGFFAERRTIGDIVKHCRETEGMNYRSNAFSGPLSRLADKGILRREKNAEGVYVYF